MNFAGLQKGNSSSMKLLATSCVDYLQEDGQDFWELTFFHYFEDSRSPKQSNSQRKIQMYF